MEKEVVNEKLEALEKVVEENKDELKAMAKTESGFVRLAKCVWKWAKKLALPIGVAIGFVLKMILDRNSDDDLEATDTTDETTEG